MSLLKYNEYLTEKVMYEVLLESKVVFSRRFNNLLSKMGDNRIASELIKIYTKDVDKIKHNFIEITDTKDSVSFTPDAKANELIKDQPNTFKIVDSQRYLTHSDSNDHIFKALGYEKEGRDVWSPDRDIVGIILKETISEKSGKTYVLFQEYIDSESPKTSVINKEAMVPTSSENTKVWSTSRNTIKVGRLVRAILKSADIKFNDKEIEDFVNLYKATFDFTQDILKQFDVVEGDDIKHWYWYENYTDGGGTLNNSCMSEVDSEYFSIYSDNPKQCNMVILYDDDGVITDGVYKSKSIKGRALLWTGKLDGQPVKFMDRIYTSNDSDVELFKQFAEKNGWWYKKAQSMYPDATLTNGTTSKNGIMRVILDKYSFDYYPYVDTLCILNDNVLSNESDADVDKSLRSTEGDYMDYYDE